MDLLTGGLSLAGGLAGLFGGGGANSVQLPQQQPVNLSGVTSNLNTMIPSLGQYNLGGQNLSTYAGLLNSAVDNPYGGFGQGVANLFGGSGIGTSLQALANSGILGGSVPGLTGAAGSILSAGFDPQQALYNRTLQQTQDQTLANLTNSGLATTPWGQGVLGNTLGNFNIDWQNNLLNRMTTGAQGAEGLLGQAGSTAQGAFDLGSAAPSAAVSTGMLPFSTYNTIATNPLGILGTGAQYGITSSQIPQTQTGDWLSYLSGANSANSIANQTAGLGLQQNQMAFNQNQAFGGNIGYGLGQLGKGFNNLNFNWNPTGQD